MHRDNVVIPALNEAGNLPRVLPVIPRRTHELILVDGQSAPANEIQSSSSRARDVAAGLDDRVRLSLVIPAHNEEARLESTLRTYGEALNEAYGGTAEIIVVANGCADGTTEIARALCAEWPSIRTIDIQAPIGKGGAVLEGFRAAKGDAVVFADADGATAISSVLSLVEGLDTHDVVIGSRHLPGSRILRQQSLKRRFLGRGFSAAARYLLGVTLSDTQCGAKAFRADAARHLVRVVAEKHWMFDLDLLLCARHSGFSIMERPVDWTDIRGSRLRVFGTFAAVVPAFWRLHRRHGRYSSIGRLLEPTEQPYASAAVHVRGGITPLHDTPAGSL